MNAVSGAVPDTPQRRNVQLTLESKLCEKAGPGSRSRREHDAMNVRNTIGVLPDKYAADAP
jgi:hypothetical protein